MTGGKWFDAAGKPDPAQAKRQGFEGAFVYVGTQGFAKNCTASYYRSLVAAGLDVIAVVEHNQHDAELGAAAGDSYARAGLTDMASMGFAAAVPLGVTADEHLTAGQIPTVVAFQSAASRVIRGAGRRAMGYGFSEFIHALRPAGLVDIEWQAGSLSLVDALVHFWQDNTGTEMIGPVVVDRDWLRRPLPGGDMSLELTTALPDPLSVAGTNTVAEGLTASLYGITSHRNGGALANAVASMQASTAGALTALATAVAAVDSDVKTAATQEAIDHAANLTAISKVGSLDPTLLENDLQGALTQLGWTPPPSVKDIAIADAAAVAPAVLALIASKLGGTP